MQNKKDKRAKADAKSTVADAGKTVSGTADAKKGVADSGKKGHTEPPAERKGGKSRE